MQQLEPNTARGCIYGSNNHGIAVPLVTTPLVTMPLVTVNVHRPSGSIQALVHHVRILAVPLDEADALERLQCTVPAMHRRRYIRGTAMHIKDTAMHRRRNIRGAMHRRRRISALQCIGAGILRVLQCTGAGTIG